MDPGSVSPVRVHTQKKRHDRVYRHRAGAGCTPAFAARIYKRLFSGKNPLAMTLVIWPDPKSEILKAIEAELTKKQSCT